MVGRGDVKSRHADQSWGQQGLLEGGVEALEFVLFVFRLLSGAQQFRLVGAAVAGVEDGGADQQRPAVAAGLDGGGHQHGQPAAVGRLEFEGDPADLALHAQQRAEVGLVVEAAAHGQQIGEGPPAHQVAVVVAEPVEQCRVDLRDGAVQQRGEVAARRVFVQVLGAVLQERGERRVVVTGLLARLFPVGSPGWPVIAALGQRAAGSAQSRSG